MATSRLAALLIPVILIAGGCAESASRTASGSAATAKPAAKPGTTPAATGNAADSTPTAELPPDRRPSATAIWMRGHWVAKPGADHAEWVPAGWVEIDPDGQPVSVKRATAAPTAAPAP